MNKLLLTSLFLSSVSVLHADYSTGDNSYNSSTTPSYGIHVQQQSTGNSPYYNSNSSYYADGSTNSSPQDHFLTTSDRELNARIRDKITGWFTDDYKNVSLNTSNGKVILEGTVDSDKAKSKLADEIRKINGVVSVNDQVQVRPSSNAKETFSQDRFQTESDRRLNVKIRDKITGWFTNDYKNISLNTSNGRVTLEGYVETDKMKSKLADEVRKIDGVASVNDQVQVRPSSESKETYPQDRFSTESDRRLNVKIRDKITGWFTNDYKNISLNTSNGRVTLEGSVDSDKAKNKLADEVRKIEGVTSVTDQVQVRPSSDTRDTYSQDQFSTESDRQLNVRIRDKITGWFTNDYKNISLNTTNGNVTIGGYVNSERALQKLTDEIRKIDGVRSITNQAMIRN